MYHQAAAVFRESASTFFAFCLVLVAMTAVISAQVGAAELEDGVFYPGLQLAETATEDDDDLIDDDLLEDEEEYQWP